MFSCASFAADLASAHACWAHIQRVFDDLEAARPLEVLQNPAERASYLLAVHSRVVAMTVTYAAVARHSLVKVKKNEKEKKSPLMVSLFFFFFFRLDFGLTALFLKKLVK